MHLLIVLILILGRFCVAAEECPQVQQEEFIEAGPIEHAAMPPQQFSLTQSLAYTLQNQLQLKISILNIQAQQGVARNAAGPFDPLFGGTLSQVYSQDLQSASSSPPKRTDDSGYQTTALFTASKQTRLGTVVSLNASIQREDNIFVFPKITSTATISFLVDQPLLRNFWFGPNTVHEQAAWLELWAVYMDGFQSTAQHILDTATQYWEVVGDQRLVEISEQAVTRLEKLAVDIQRLIDEEQLARVDINQAYEQITEQKILTLQAKQQMYSAFELLKLNMGDVQICPFDEEHPFILDDFAPVDLNAQGLESLLPGLIEQAITYRYDIQASAIREREANILLQGAYNAELPQVDIFGGVEKTDFKIGGGSERTFSSIEMDHPQTNWTIGLNFSVPLYNDAAKGLLRQRQAQKYQAMLNTQFLTQSAVTALRAALANQISLLRQLKKANERVELNRTLIDDEWKKLRAGYSTLFVLLSFEARLTDALGEFSNIYKRYMQNIVLLRFLTGSLFESDTCMDLIALEDVKTLPGMYANPPLQSLQ